ncbi:MAG: hypothetical protein ABJA80_04085 [bacterium]
MSKPIAHFETAILLGQVFGFQCTGDDAVLCVGIPKGRERPALWLAAHGRTVMLAQFHGPTFAAMAVKFLDQHSDAVQHVINQYREKSDGSTT